MTRLGDLFSKPVATNSLPKSLTFLGGSCKGVRSIIFIVKSFLDYFYRHLATFYWSHWMYINHCFFKKKKNYFPFSSCSLYIQHNVPKMSDAAMGFPCKFCKKMLTTQSGLKTHQTQRHKQVIMQGSGCGSYGRVVASNTKGLQFDSSHRQNLYWPFVYCQLYWKDESKENEAAMAHSFITGNHARVP